ncbi:terminase small subunit [Pantoea sp. BAV 3049]|uniref:terminase small subunit n=1 Tax=Pantoea sp. BAV 3049 TaxID=2654188 RepID=UPI00131ADFB1|nr:terminase small subunit [Pantoea sp. BAV 3049]
MLTGQKKKFADALMKGSNQRQAAIQAGYSEKTAKVKGSQLAKDKDVIGYMERVRAINPADSLSEPVRQADLPPVETPTQFDDPIAVMKRIMSDNLLVDPKLSLEAAAKLAPYVCQKMGDTGKKEAKDAAAKKAASKFSGMAPPKLVVSNGR